ncbi:methyltransferase domain-containing protein [Rhodobacterales bacterium HKCCSP123]|nr:methyltransferase domain-containing protein [Rhodobacterales bacterium HKCCSP123]
MPPLTVRRGKIAALASHFRLDGPGLELGPHVAPMFRRSEGINVRYLETRSADELRALMRQEGRDPSLVEEIDYILERGRTLAQHVGEARFDWVTSSHVVEHIPDFLGHLVEVAEVLTDEGVYGLVVPDRNYCFDCLKAPTLLGHVIEAHLTQTRPGAVAHMINEWRYGARPQGVKVGGWTEAQGKAPLVRKMADWQKHVSRVLRTGGQEVETWFGHQWFFDPRNFGEIICDLIELKAIPFQLTALVPTYQMDFIAVLRKTDSPDLAASRALVERVSSDYRVPVYSRKILDP